MVSRTRSTNGQPTQQPVRFYKFVALTFLFVTVLLLGIIVFMSSKRADITVITRSEPIHVNASVSIGGINSDNIVVNGFVTSTLTETSKLFSPNGTKQEDGLAEGSVTLFNQTTSAQPLVATTRLLTADGKLFRLKSGVVVPAQGSIEALVYADEPGSQGDIGPSTFTIPGLREDKQKDIFAKSEKEMSGGIRTIGVLNTEDISQAEKTLLEELKQQGSQVLQSLYPDKTGLFTVAQYTFEHDGELGQEVDAFNLTGKATVVGVFYQEEELRTYAKDMLEKQVVSNSEILESVESEPTAIIDTYDLNTNAAKLTITQSGLVNLDQNSRELQKLMFFGKTEDEVRRYVMSLDHVQGVEMHFRPMWNRSVPHVAGHVNITVRQVQ